LSARWSANTSLFARRRYLILQAEGTFDINAVFAGILVLTAFALLLDWAVCSPSGGSWSGSRAAGKPRRCDALDREQLS